MVKYDKFINFLSTDIIAISPSVKKILIDLEGVPEKKIHLIYHGFNFDDFKNIGYERTYRIIQKYNIPVNDKNIIGVISRYIDWKGVMYIINAFKKILKKYPDTFLVLANAEGPQEKEIKSLLKTLPDDSYVEIKFENDILALYTTFDLFVHVPIDPYCEAFGQVYVEAMAMNIPCIVTLSGIASEYIKNMENALVVPYKDTDALIKAMEFAFNNPNTMKLLAKNAKNDVIKLFPIQKQISQFVNLYEQK
jgi:glycosyltransferase involved in cell wall biosynthesis